MISMYTWTCRCECLFFRVSPVRDFYKNTLYHQHNHSTYQQFLSGSPDSTGSASGGSNNSGEFYSPCLPGCACNCTSIIHCSTNTNSDSVEENHCNSGTNTKIGISSTSSVPIPIPTSMSAAVMAHTEVKGWDKQNVSMYTCTWRHYLIVAVI